MAGIPPRWWYGPGGDSRGLGTVATGTEEAFALWSGDQWSTPSEIYEINVKISEEDAAEFLHPVDPDLLVSRGRAHSIPAN